MNPWSQYFSDAELGCRCGQCAYTWPRMSDRLMDQVMEMREACAFPFVVTSALRCPDHDIAVGGTGKGEHTRGEALDIQVAGDRAYHLVEQAFLAGIRRIGMCQAGPAGQRFVHLGAGLRPFFPEPTIWTYSVQPE